jgi:tryptophan 2,3-dioxygenase
MPLNICIGSRQGLYNRKKSYLLQEFERSIKIFSASNGTIQFHQYLAKIQTITDQDQNNHELKNAMRHLDHTINITWVMQHLNVAIKYIDHSGRRW